MADRHDGAFTFQVIVADLPLINMTIHWYDVNRRGSDGKLTRDLVKEATEAA